MNGSLIYKTELDMTHDFKKSHVRKKNIFSDVVLMINIFSNRIILNYLKKMTIKSSF